MPIRAKSKPDSNLFGFGSGCLCNLFGKWLRPALGSTESPTSLPLRKTERSDPTALSMPQSFLRIVPYSGRAGISITLSLVNFILLSGPFFCPLPIQLGL